MNKINVILVCITIIPPLVLADSFFAEHQQGWFWYHDSNALDKKASLDPLLNPTETMYALQKKVEESLNRAILSPTEGNLKNYARHYYLVINQGQHFTDAYQAMLLKNPEYDYSLRFPLNTLSQAIYTKEQEQAIESAVKAFAKTHGFFFFFKGTCAYCRLFAESLKPFADKYGISVIPISLDGNSLSQFPQPMKDLHAASQFGVQTVPALFAVNPQTKEIVPITHKAISALELEENIFNFVRLRTIQAPSPFLLGGLK